MKVLALDIGEKRVGVAAGDTEAKIAIPVSIISASEVMAGGAAFRRVLEDYEPELLVVGLPLSLDGGEHQQARRVRQAAERIGKMCGLPVVYQDERLSSAEARRSLREAGWTEREMRGKIDMVAASLILRAYLDAAYLSEQGSSGR
jgi:putative Holliday junction resolvase